MAASPSSNSERFAIVSKEERDFLLKDAVTDSTRTATAFWIRTFEEFCSSTEVSCKLETVDEDTLSDVLERFYCGLKPEFYFRLSDERKPAIVATYSSPLSRKVNQVQLLRQAMRHAQLDLCVVVAHVARRLSHRSTGSINQALERKTVVSTCDIAARGAIQRHPISLERGIP